MSRNKRTRILGIPGVSPEASEFRLLEDDFFRLLENGDFRILE
jgi:hypothetical protein